jgi:REP element-mobilizing transposase RayT
MRTDGIARLCLLNPGWRSNPVSPGFRPGLVDAHRMPLPRGLRVPLTKLYIYTYSAHMPHEPGSVVRCDALAYFITWSTYGSWLPGDARGWVDDRGAIRAPNPRLMRRAAASMKHPPVTLSAPDRVIVEHAIREQCRFRGWHLLAANCRSSHVHVVVAAPDRQADEVLRCLKAWCSRSLADRDTRRSSWWTRGGSIRQLFETRNVENVVAYVMECQDEPRGH